MPHIFSRLDWIGCTIVGVDIGACFERHGVLWLIPRDITVHDIDLPTEDHPKDSFQV
jgi:hypothetical protein